MNIIVFLLDYPLRSRDILQFCYFSYREARGLTYMYPLSHNKKFIKNFRKNLKISTKIFQKKLK